MESVRRAAAIEIQRVWRGRRCRRTLDEEYEKWVVTWIWDRPSSIVEVSADSACEEEAPWGKCCEQKAAAASLSAVALFFSAGRGRLLEPSVDETLFDELLQTARVRQSHHLLSRRHNAPSQELLLRLRGGRNGVLAGRKDVSDGSSFSFQVFRADLAPRPRAPRVEVYCQRPPRLRRKSTRHFREKTQIRTAIRTSRARRLYTTRRTSLQRGS